MAALRAESDGASTRSSGSGHRLTTEPVSAGTPQVLDGVKVVHFGHFDPAVFAEPDHGQGAAPRRRDRPDVSDTGRFTVRAPAVAAHAASCRADVMLVGFPGHADVPVARLGERPAADPGALRRVRLVVRERRGPRSCATRRRRGEAVPARRPGRVPFCDPDAARHRHARPLLRRVASASRESTAARLGRCRRRRDQARAGSRRFACFGCSCTRASSRCTASSTSCAPRTSSSSTTRASASTSSAPATPKPTIRRLAGELDVAERRTSSVGDPTRSSPALMAASHVCLGIFGTSGKAQRVIPNKVFDALAVGAGGHHRRHAGGAGGAHARRHRWLCTPGDPRALADSIARAPRRVRRPGRAIARRVTSCSSRSSGSTRSPPIVAPIVLEVLGR